jgi:hypothetical protein
MKINNDFRYNYRDILTIVLSIVITRWFFLFYSFQESIENFLIFSFEDYLYFPFVINLSEINFRPDYLGVGLPERILPIPIYSIIIHSVLYKIFGLYSFFILELLFFYIFIYLLLNIFKEINFNFYQAIASVLILIFFLSINFYLKSIYNLPYLSILNLFDYRFPRPLVTSIFFLLGFLFILKFYKNNQANNFFILFGIILALNFASMIYNFIILGMFFLIIFIKKNVDNKFYNFYENLKKILLLGFFFLLFSLPFLVIYFFSENDYLRRIGLIYLNFNQKIYLLKYILTKLFSIKFILLFILITFFYNFLKKNKYLDKNILNFIYIFFLSSILSLVLFVIFAPAITEIYHLINLVVMSAIFVILIFSLFLLILIINYFSYNFIKKKINYIIFFSLFFIIFINYLSFSNIKNKDLNFRNDLIQFNSLFPEISKLDSLLSFNTKIQVWWLLKEKKNLTSVDSIITPANDFNLEKNFFENMLFLKISPVEFDNMLKNKKFSWRYNNHLIKYLSFYKYQANSLFTFNNSSDFDNDILDYIKSSSPLYTMQIAMPDDERNKLVESYKKIKQFQHVNPDLIILDKDTFVEKYIIDSSKYCSLNEFYYLKIYIKREKYKCS